MHSVSLLLLAIASAKDTITWWLTELALRSSFSNAELGLRRTLDNTTHHVAVTFLLYRSSSSLSLLLLTRTFDIRDLGSNVIRFLVLTPLEQPEKLSKIKKPSFFRTSRDHVYYGSTFRTSVRCAVCAVWSREEKRNHTVRPQCSKFYRSGVAHFSML